MVKQEDSKVDLLDRNPIELNILNDLSKKYLQTALEQRQQRISDGLKFLNNQAPSLESKTEKIQEELATFRKKYNLLEPSKEGVNLKKRIILIEDEIFSLESYSDRLKNIKYAINKNRISALGQEYAASENRIFNGEGFVISDSNQALINEILKVKAELATARSTYKKGSILVNNLEKRLDALKPLLKASQLESVETALTLNSGRLISARSLNERLKEQFLIQPDLIKTYETLQQKLNIAKRNLAGLVNARETFQLEIAQSSVPWKLIAPPEINPVPISPSIPKNHFYAISLGLVTSVIAALLSDKLDYFSYSDEVKDDLKLPV